MSKWINKGSLVLVISGNDKGKFGEVLARKKDKVIVKDVNIRKKHMKSRKQDMPSEIIHIERPINISNVAICDATGNKIKLKPEIAENGDKILTHLIDNKKVEFRVLRKK